jgi:hypothetical protein
MRTTSFTTRAPFTTNGSSRPTSATFRLRTGSPQVNNSTNSSPFILQIRRIKDGVSIIQRITMGWPSSLRGGGRWSYTIASCKPWPSLLQVDSHQTCLTPIYGTRSRTSWRRRRQAVFIMSLRARRGRVWPQSISMTPGHISRLGSLPHQPRQSYHQLSSSCSPFVTPTNPHPLPKLPNQSLSTLLPLQKQWNTSNQTRTLHLPTRSGGASCAGPLIMVQKNATPNFRSLGAPLSFIRLPQGIGSSKTEARASVMPTMGREISNLGQTAEIRTSVVDAKKALTERSIATPKPYWGVVTPLHAFAFGRYLEAHGLLDDYFDVTEGIINGFTMSCTISPSHTKIAAHYPGALEHPEIIDSHIDHELSLGRYIGPFSSILELETILGRPFLCHPLNVIPKSNSKWGIVEDLSYKFEGSSQSANELMSIEDIPVEWGGC